MHIRTSAHTCPHPYHSCLLNASREISGESLVVLDQLRIEHHHRVSNQRLAVLLQLEGGTPNAVSGEDGGGAWRDHEARKNSYTDVFLLDFFENLFC